MQAVGRDNCHLSVTSCLRPNPTTCPIDYTESERASIEILDVRVGMEKFTLFHCQLLFFSSE